eukprot:NODE_923_length_1554_cov_73.086896_g912_i0.p1 GENE.NODE_923_length_1554_cov_73.086896_g912_i0~~NODE_923_length_1554_cov_73.086896_g912_i0.p1  ORF type:complete len:444 (-),score=128.96 NODE_923_length_1554_cov_73.086896_g912_i0:135-1466(-)
MASMQPPPTTVKLDATVSHINGLRVLSVMEKAIERLSLLSLLTSNADSNPSGQDHGDAKGMDDGLTGVGTILEEQQRLQQRYEELMVATATSKPNLMDPALDPHAYSDVGDETLAAQKDELASVSKQLKELSKQMCRQLKENPNDSNNWKKVLTERTELAGLLQSCVRELMSSATTQQPSDTLPTLRGQGLGGPVMRQDLSYEVFAKKVIEEQSEKLWADEIVKREKETNMNVKQLQSEVTAERQNKEKDIEERQQKLNELKTRVRKLKQETKEQSDKRRAETEAAAGARAREAKDVQRGLEERIKCLEKKIALEKEVFSQIERHLNTKSNELATKTQDWNLKSLDENKDLDDQIMQDKKKREDQIESLKFAEEQHAHEVERKKEREETERKNESDRKRWEDLQSAEYAASTKLQAAFKAYLIRKQLADSKKKKRKRGGKKKK